MAGARWGVEDCFAEAKGEAGLDHYQVRRYRAWYRHVTLSMLAHAFLAVSARASRPAPRPPGRPLPAAASLKRGPDPCGQRFAPPRTYAPPAFVTDENGRDLIPLTAAEARRLFNLHTRVTRPADSTSNGQPGDADARPPPVNLTTPAGPEAAGRCSQRSPIRPGPAPPRAAG